MNDDKKRSTLVVGVAIGGVLLIGLIMYLLFKPGQQKTGNAARNLDSTEMTSPVAKSNDNLTITYGGDANPNYYAVKQPFKLFGRDNIPVNDFVKDRLDQFLPNLLLQQVTPTYAPTYIHVRPDTVRCDNQNNCTMMIYIDSPESYFELSLKKVNGTYAPKLTQQPWKGVPQ